ncbi:hypothetical protein [Yersinia enterocolitica]|uniref:hypothetical protein n=1 Tax=Yersinia enterocolitica TaxID=630 RepID=UPI001C60A8EE|nr:hypothetical protein [Yersinia enterocolitica]MBW5853022.1 hypothetical protein [Yersinia enterocolitica]
MNRLLFITSIIILSGCISAEKKNSMKVTAWSNEVMSQSVEGQVTVSGIRSQFKNVTGQDLATPISALSCPDSKCYYSAWSDSYMTSMISYRDKKSKEEDVKLRECAENPKCIRDKEFSRYMSIAKSAYQQATLTATPIYSSRADRIARSLCNKAIYSQSNGMTINQWTRSVDDAGLFDGDNPFGSIAVSCWWMGSFGLKESSQVFNKT